MRPSGGSRTRACLSLGPGQERSWRLRSILRHGPHRRRENRLRGRGNRRRVRLKVREEHRGADSVPRVEVVTASDGRPPARHRAGDAGREPLAESLHRRHPVVYANLVLPRRFITKGATKLLMALDIEEGGVRYLDNEIGVGRPATATGSPVGWRPRTSRPSSGSATTLRSSLTPVSRLTRTTPL